jgi:hypothetical protein
VLEKRCPQAAGKNADLEALEIRRCCDRACSRGDLSESHRPIEYLEANVADASSEVITDLAVHDRPDLVVARPAIANAADRGDRHQGREHPRRGDIDVEGARSHLREHVGARSQLTVREDADLDRTGGGSCTFFATSRMWKVTGEPSGLSLPNFSLNCPGAAFVGTERSPQANAEAASELVRTDLRVEPIGHLPGAASGRMRAV